MSTTTATHPASVASTGCCPPFDPASLDDREIVWKDHPFVRKHVHALFHVPFDMDRKMREAMAQIDAAHAAPAQPLTLSEESSPWGSELFIDVTKPVPGADMATLSGTFLTKVFDGPYSHMRRWCDDMRLHVAARSRHLEKLYFAYTTCPKCAKAYGHNYVVAFAKVADPV